MTSVYINGCACGANNVRVAKVKASDPETQVFNTRVDRTRLLEHIEYQERAGMGKSPIQIVVEGNGAIVTVLSEWKR